MNHKEFSQKGGRSKSDKKREAGRLNLANARAKRAELLLIARNAAGNTDSGTGQIKPFTAHPSATTPPSDG